MHASAKSLPALFLLLAIALLCSAAAAHVGPVDTSFGDAGMRNYAFQAVSNGNHDQATVGCSAADGSFTVTGIASSQNRIVTMRLLPNGDYDDSFGFGGRVSVTLPGSYNDFVPGLCQPDGHLVMARASTAPGGEQDLQILRVLKHTGQLDAGFGSGGVVSIDLDVHVAGLGMQEMPLGVNALPNGDIAVSGQTQPAQGGYRGFVVLLAANGMVRAVRVFDDVTQLNTTTVVEAPDGRLWAFGKDGLRSGAYRTTLDRQTLASHETLLATQAGNAAVHVGGGRAVDAQTVVLAGISRASGAGAPATPLLLVFRAASASLLALPAATLDGNAMEIGLAPGRQSVTVLPGRRLLYAAQGKQPGATFDAGIYLGLARIGRSAAADRAEPGLGGGAARFAAFRPAATACAGVPASHNLSRMTLWKDMPALVGAVGMACAGGSDGQDYLVTRLRPDYLFADGLD